MSTSASIEFSRRLKEACDNNESIPAYGKGRQVVIANSMKVSQEAVRKWFEGDSMPRPAKMKQLAAYLAVDHEWLALGITPVLNKEELKKANRRSAASVYIVTGSIMLEGGNCAWPSETDARSEFVDIYAIFRGEQTALHVSTGTPTAEGEYDFALPDRFKEVTCVGLIPLGPGKYHLLSMPPEMIDKHKRRKSGDFVVTLKLVGTKYMVGEDQCHKFKTFGEIL